MRSRFKNAVLPPAIAIAIASIIAMPVTGQTPKPAAHSTTKATAAKKTWTVPKTSWGDPDLQGIWPSTAMNDVPLERPRALEPGPFSPMQNTLAEWPDLNSRLRLILKSLLRTSQNATPKKAGLEILQIRAAPVVPARFAAILG